MLFLRNSHWFELAIPGSQIVPWNAHPRQPKMIRKRPLRATAGVISIFIERMGYGVKAVTVLQGKATSLPNQDAEIEILNDHPERVLALLAPSSHNLHKAGGS